MKELTNEQKRDLAFFLKSRKFDIENDIENLGILKSLLELRQKP